jgi:hypothetical protein
MSFITYLLTSFCVIAFIEAVQWDGAQSTSLSSSPDWTPIPTLVPLLGAEPALFNSHDLRRRQDARGVYCGYINGRLSKNSPNLAPQFKA